MKATKGNKFYWLINLCAALIISSSNFALSATQSGSAVCKTPDTSFQIFLSSFTDNIAFQRSRYILPLVSRSGNYLTPDASVALLALAQVKQQKYPLIYSGPDRKRLNLEQDIILLQPNRYAEVSQANAGEADDIRLLYHFRKIEGCWFLEEVDDRGL